MIEEQIDIVTLENNNSIFPEAQSRLTFETICDLEQLGTFKVWADKDIAIQMLLNYQNKLDKTIAQIQSDFSNERATFKNWLDFVKEYHKDTLELMAFKLMPIRMRSILLYMITKMQAQTVIKVDWASAHSEAGSLKLWATVITERAARLKYLDLTSDMYEQEIRLIWEDCSYLYPKVMPKPEKVNLSQANNPKRKSATYYESVKPLDNLTPVDRLSYYSNQSERWSSPTFKYTEAQKFSNENSGSSITGRTYFSSDYKPSTSRFTPVTNYETSDFSSIYQQKTSNDRFFQEVPVNKPAYDPIKYTPVQTFQPVYTPVYTPVVQTYTTPLYSTGYVPIRYGGVRSYYNRARQLKNGYTNNQYQGFSPTFNKATPVNNYQTPRVNNNYQTPKVNNNFQTPQVNNNLYQAKGSSSGGIGLNSGGGSGSKVNKDYENTYQEEQSFQTPQTGNNLYQAKGSSSGGIGLNSGGGSGSKVNNNFAKTYQEEQSFQTPQTGNKFAKTYQEEQSFQTPQTGNKFAKTTDEEQSFQTPQTGDIDFSKTYKEDEQSYVSSSSSANKKSKDICGKDPTDLNNYHTQIFSAIQKGGSSQTVIKTRAQYFKDMLDIHTKTCIFLQSLVMAYCGHEAYRPLYNKIEETKVENGSAQDEIMSLHTMIHRFYEKFYFVLSDHRPLDCITSGANTLRSAISIAFTGVDVDNPKYFLHRMFFSSAFFAYVLQVQINQDIIEFDKMILLGLTGRADLYVLDNWTKKGLTIHIEFLNEFNKHYYVGDDSVTWELNSDIIPDLFNLHSVPQPPRQATNIFIMACYVLIYRIYVQLRADRALTPTMDKTAVFKKIFYWMTDPNTDWTEANTALYNGYFTFLDMSYYYEATISYMCIQIECEGTADELRITTNIFKQLKIREDTNPPHIREAIFYLPRIHDWWNVQKLSQYANMFYQALVGLSWPTTISLCPMVSKPRPLGETGPYFNKLRENKISYTIGCTETIYYNFKKIFTTYVFATEVTKEILVEIYQKFRMFMDNNSDPNIQGLCMYLTIRLFRFYSLNIKERASITKSMYFIRKFYLDYLAEEIKTLYAEESFGLYGFMTAMLLENSKFTYMFKLKSDQVEMFYRDIFFLIHYPVSNARFKDPKMKEVEQATMLYSIEKFFANAPVKKPAKGQKLSLADYKMYTNAASMDKTSNAQFDYFGMIDYLSTVALLADHLDFFNFCNRYHVYYKQLTKKRADAPFQALATFYSLMYKIRMLMDTEVVDSYRYVLDKIEMCLKYTSQRFKSDDPDLNQKNAKEMCHLSYRKYSELYFVYKLYLMMDCGYSDISFTNYVANLPPIRTGFLFYLGFTIEQVNMFMTAECAKDGSDSTVICQVWGVLPTIIDNVKSRQENLMTFSEVASLIEQHFEIDDAEIYYVEDERKTPEENRRAKDLKMGAAMVHQKIKLIVLYDAIHSVQRGLSYQNDAFLGMLEPHKTLPVVNGNVASNSNFAKGKLWTLAGSPEEIKMFSDFLQFTYRKLKIGATQKEASAMVKWVFSYLKSSPSIAGDKMNEFSLYSLLSHRDIHSVSFLKFFLIFADTIEDYQYCAKYMVDNEVFLEVVNVETERNEEDILELISTLNSRSSEAGSATSPDFGKNLVKMFRQLLVEKLDVVAASQEAIDFHETSVSFDNSQLSPMEFDPTRFDDLMFEHNMVASSRSVFEDQQINTAISNVKVSSFNQNVYTGGAYQNKNYGGTSSFQTSSVTLTENLIAQEQEEEEYIEEEREVVMKFKVKVKVSKSGSMNGPAINADGKFVQEATIQDFDHLVNMKTNGEINIKFSHTDFIKALLSEGEEADSMGIFDHKSFEDNTVLLSSSHIVKETLNQRSSVQNIIRMSQMRRLELTTPYSPLRQLSQSRSQGSIADLTKI